MKSINVCSIQETTELAKRLASLLPDNACLLLNGDLGAGKTTFTKELGKAFGITKTINSPTFTILKSYSLPNGNFLHHIDAYRLEGIHQDLGFEDLLDEGICVIEWPKFIEDSIPDRYLMISISITEGEARIFDMIPEGAEYEKLVEAL